MVNLPETVQMNLHCKCKFSILSYKLFENSMNILNTIYSENEGFYRDLCDIRTEKHAPASIRARE